MANKKISELPYIGVSKLSGNTLVPLVTYFSAATGDTVHTYTEDLQSYILSGQTITGATYSAGTITFTNNSGGTFSVSGITTLTGNFLSLSGGSVTGSTQFTAGLSANTISATTYQNLPTDITITGGTLSGNTIIFTNNTGGTFNVTGITDNYVTGGTFNYTTNQLTLSQQNGNVIINGLQDKYFTGTTWNTGTYDLSINRNDGFSSTVSLAILASDLKVTGGTYNSANGVATFTNNSGGTFQVTGFLTGYTDTFVTGGTYSNGTITFQNNSGTTFQVTGITLGNDYLPLSGGTVTGSTTFNQGLTANSLLVTNNIDSSNRTLNDSSNFPSVLWESRTLSNSLGLSIIDWNNGLIYGPTTNKSIDWNNRILYDTDGTTIVFDWANGNLTGLTNVTSSNISASTLTVNNKSITGDTFVTGGTYSAGTLTFTNNNNGSFTVSGLVTGVTQTITGNYLPLSGGTVTGDTVFNQGLSANTLSVTNSIDSSSKTLFDNGNFPSVLWDTRTLLNNSLVSVLDWNNGIIYNSSSLKSIDWNNKILYANDGSTSVFNWSTGVLSANTITANTLNIKNIGSGTSVTNLGIDSSGNIISGATGSGSITSGATLGNGLSIFNSGTTNTLFFNSITGDSLNKITASTANNTIEIGINEQNLTLWPLVVTGNRLMTVVFLT